MGWPGKVVVWKSKELFFPGVNSLTAGAPDPCSGALSAEFGLAGGVRTPPARMGTSRHVLSKVEGAKPRICQTETALALRVEV